MDTILHITTREAWALARRRGSYRSDSLDGEGFIHCSTPAQTVETANRFFRGAKDLVLLCIDPARVRAELRFEPPAGVTVHDSRAELFPHLYGPLELDAVIRVVDFPPSATGEFVLPASLT